jgi:hypothetical protein
VEQLAFVAEELGLHLLRPIPSLQFFVVMIDLAALAEGRQIKAGEVSELIPAGKGFGGFLLALDEQELGLAAVVGS